MLWLLIGCKFWSLNETRSSCAKAVQLKLQAGSGENNANVPDLVEVWQPPQCIPGAVWSMEGSISCATLALFWWNGRPATKLSLVWFPHNSYCHCHLREKSYSRQKLQKSSRVAKDFASSWPVSNSISPQQPTKLPSPLYLGLISEFLWLGFLF